MRIALPIGVPWPTRVMSSFSSRDSIGVLLPWIAESLDPVPQRRQRSGFHPEPHQAPGAWNPSLYVCNSESSAFGGVPRAKPRASRVSARRICGVRICHSGPRPDQARMFETPDRRKPALRTADSVGRIHDDRPLFCASRPMAYRNSSRHSARTGTSTVAGNQPTIERSAASASAASPACMSSLARSRAACSSKRRAACSRARAIAW